MRRLLLRAALGWLLATAGLALAAERCGEVVGIEAHDRSTLRYAFVPPSGAQALQAGGPVTLLLLAGGAGHLDLDAQGCARKLKGNSLVRSIPAFTEAGFGTALVDAPSDFHGEDGLGGFRTDARHAQDLGQVIAGLRTRTRGTVWVVGTSRGAISAANAAARLAGPAAPDGLVLTSVLMAGQAGAKKAWVAHSVFDLPLEDITVPVLVVLLQVLLVEITLLESRQELASLLSMKPETLSRILRHLADSGAELLILALEQSEKAGGLGQGLTKVYWFVQVLI